MTLRYLAFSEKGMALAESLAETLGGEASRCNAPLSLDAWTQLAFTEVQGLVFVGAAGIAVRAIAPHLRSKTTDPAVVVVDEGGHFAVPILSGHLGGANDLARAIAAVCGAVPAVTTATDVGGVFAVDEWAKRQNCRVLHPENIKEVSACVLAGGMVKIYSTWMIEGDRPPQVEQVCEGEYHVRHDIRTGEQQALHLVPRILALGIGCRKGTPQAALETCFQKLLEESGIAEEAVYTAASIDLKKEEAGLLDFCSAHGWPCRFFAAETLKAVPGEFTASAFVAQTTGVDNVCERSAVLASGGTLYWEKITGHGVTMALAQAPYAPTWRWRSDGE